MQLKQYIRYEMQFSGKWAGICNGSIGICFFLRILYYFGIVNLQDVGGGELFICLIMPLLTCIAFIALFRVIKWNAPGIYAIIGCVICLLLLIWNFRTGDFLRIFLSIFMYIIAGLVLLATAGGYLPGRLPATVIFTAILIFRFFIYSVKLSGIDALIPEYSAIFLIVSLLALTRCFTPRVKRA